MMHIATVKKTLESIRVVYGRTILDENTYARVIEDAVQDATQTWVQFRRNSKSHPTWGYEIPETNPLRFKPSEVLNSVVVDVYCKVQWSDDSNVPVTQDIKMRIWSNDEAVVFRPHLDSEKVLEKLTDPTRLHKGRVVSRFHFDRVDHSQGKSQEYHPEFHMQVGGISNDDELCWHPKNFDIPRITHHPMELLLTCQLVAINFFPEKYVDISKEILWERQLLATQRTVILDYYESCARAIKDDKPLLDMLRS